jgi:hypothetical protein
VGIAHRNGSTSPAQVTHRGERSLIIIALGALRT